MAERPFKYAAIVVTPSSKYKRTTQFDLTTHGDNTSFEMLAQYDGKDGAYWVRWSITRQSFQRLWQFSSISENADSTNFFRDGVAVRQVNVKVPVVLNVEKVWDTCEEE